LPKVSVVVASHAQHLGLRFLRVFWDADHLRVLAAALGLARAGPFVHQFAEVFGMAVGSVRHRTLLL